MRRRGKRVRETVNLEQSTVRSGTHCLQCSRVWVIQWMRFENQCIFPYCTLIAFFWPNV